MCGEATRADLESAYNGLLERKYDAEKQKLNEKIKALEAQKEEDNLAGVPEVIRVSEIVEIRFSNEDSDSAS